MSSPPSRLKSILGHLAGPPNNPSPPPNKNHQSTSEPPQLVHHFNHLSPTYFLERAATIEPDATAVVHITPADHTLHRTYAELADRARGLAYYLIKHGFGSTYSDGRGDSKEEAAAAAAERTRVRTASDHPRQPGTRIGIIAPNTPAFLETIFGVPAAGAAVVPVNIRLEPASVAYVLAFAEVDLVIVDAAYEELLEVWRRENPGVGVLVDDDSGVDGAYNAAVNEGLAFDAAMGGRGWAALHSARSRHEDDTIAIPFTSGTTSLPKGVEYTHRGAYLAALANLTEVGLNMPSLPAFASAFYSSSAASPSPEDGLGRGLGPGEGRCRFLWTLPMFHAMGWTFPWSVTAVRGTHVCLRKIDYSLLWRLLREQRITHFNAAPTVHIAMCSAAEAAPLPHPVTVMVAGSPPTATLFERMINLNLHPIHAYGMTETYGPLTTASHLPTWASLSREERYARLARQGHGFLTSLAIRVVRPSRPSSPLEDVARDGKEVGEIVFFGNICAKGYFKDLDATAALFAGGGLHSGDLAVWHPDGSAQIVDREKDVIISGGENISSVAIESVLARHPGVLEAGVVAVPDERWGERPKAFVVVRADKEGRVTGEELLEWLRGREGMSKFMIPREIEIVPDLPKTATGKIQKNVLRERAKKGWEGVRWSSDAD